MPTSTTHLAAEDDDAIHASAVSLVHLWRRVKALEGLPLQEADRVEIEQQKELIRAYILAISDIRQSGICAGAVAQAILEDIAAFAEEANCALDDAGVA